MLYLDTETDLAPAFAVVGVGNERERSEKLPKTGWAGILVVPGSGDVDNEAETEDEDGGLSLLILISGVAAVVLRVPVPPSVDALVPGAGTEGIPRSNGSADSCAGGERLITGCMVYSEEMIERVRIVTRFHDTYRNGNWNSNSHVRLTRTDPPKLSLLNTPCPRSTLPSTSPIPDPDPEVEVEVEFVIELEDEFSACPDPDADEEAAEIEVEAEGEEKAAETPLIPFIPTFDFGPDEVGMAIVDKVGEVEFKEVEAGASGPPAFDVDVMVGFEGEEPNPNPGVKGLFQSAVALAEMMGGEIGPVNPRFRLEYVGLTRAFKLLLLVLVPMLLLLLRLEPRLRLRFRLFSFLWWLMVIGTGTGEGDMVMSLSIEVGRRVDDAQSRSLNDSGEGIRSDLDWPNSGVQIR